MYFFPACDPAQLGYDCAPKAINSALGFPFLTYREQVVDLIGYCTKRGKEYAQTNKALGGIRFSELKNFAVSREYSYSFKLLKTFDLVDINMRRK